MKMKTEPLAWALSLCLIPACGGDDTTSGSTDTATETDTGSDTTDASTSDDSEGTTAGPTEPTGTDSDSSTGVTDPTTDPSTTDPSTTDPSTTDPSTTDPSTTDPSTTDTDTTTMGGDLCPGLGPGGLLLHTTLDDAAAVMTPVVGQGAGQVNTNPADDFVPALNGDGVNLDEGGEFVRYPQQANGGDNIDFTQGTIDFCYRPDYDHTDGQNHALFEAQASMQSGGGFLRVRKAAMNNNNTLQVLYREPGMGGQFGEFNADPSDYQLLAGEWYRITVSWDFTVGPQVQNIHLYIDGVEVIDNSPPTGPAQMPTPSPNEFVSVGVFTGQQWPASGVVDDFKLYDSALAP